MNVGFNEYVFRFNRRFWPMVGFESILRIAVQALSPSYEGLRGVQRRVAAFWSVAKMVRPMFWGLTG